MRLELLLALLKGVQVIFLLELIIVVASSSTLQQLHCYFAGQEGREHRDASWFPPTRRAPTGNAGGAIEGFKQRSPGMEDSGPSKEAVSTFWLPLHLLFNSKKLYVLMYL